MTANRVWINAFGQRLADVVPVILLATFLVFGVYQQLVPGDLAVTLAGENATPQRVQEIRDFYGLDQPLVVQYAHWLDQCRAWRSLAIAALRRARGAAALP